MHPTLRSSLLPVAFTLAVSAACYSSSNPEDADAGDVDDVGDVRDVRDVEEECTTPVCFSDFPCRDESFCEAPTRVRNCRSIPCWETCGTRCCSGASCGGSTAEDCADGSVCLEQRTGTEPWSGRLAQCHPDPEVFGPVDGWSPPDADAWAYCN